MRLEHEIEWTSRPGRMFEEPRCYTFAIVAVGAVAAGATAYAGYSASQSQKYAANKAAQSQSDANKLNYQMFQESHGSNGSAVLPTYLTDANGQPFEGNQLGKDLVGAYNQTALPLSTFQGAAAKTAQAQEGASGLTNDIFSGGITNKMLHNAAPVQEARLATAKSSSLDALQKTLDQIDSQQASRGYVGDSYGNRLLKFQGANAAGNAVGAASQQNLQQNADIRNYGDITLPMQNMQLPYQMARQNGQTAMLPGDMYLENLGQRMQPFNAVKIGYTGPFQYQPLPTAGPGAYMGGANALAGAAGSLNQGVGTYMQYRNQQQLMGQQQQYLDMLKQQQMNTNLMNTGMYQSPALYNSVPANYGIAGGAGDAMGGMGGGIGADVGGSAAMSSAIV